MLNKIARKFDLLLTKLFGKIMVALLKFAILMLGLIIDLSEKNGFGSELNELSKTIAKLRYEQ